MKLQHICESDVGAQLRALYAQDQAERQQYQQYLGRFPDWRQAAAAWARDQRRPLDDLFGDRPRLQLARQVITPHIEQIKANRTTLKLAWLLVQHMDQDVAFQRWFLQHLRPGSTDWKYLTDRTLINQGLPQQHNTQTE